MKIRLERVYPHPIESIWTALTDRRAIEQWWVETDFEPEVGHEFYFQDEPQGSWDGRVTGRVLEVSAPTRIRFSWQGDGHDTTVCYQLERLESGTRLTIEHDGFQGMRGLLLRTLLRFGWGKLVKRLLPEMASHIATKGIDVAFERPSKKSRIADKAA